MNKKFQQLWQHFAQPHWDDWVDAQPPQLYYAEDGVLAPLLKQLPQLKQRYQPTPWLINRHLHMLYFDLIKKRRIGLQYDRIEQLHMQDGGVTGIAWYGEHVPADTPTIVVLHTITGSPQSMSELVRDLHQHTGWRIALCLRRGHGQLPMPVPKMSLFGSTQDLREQLQAIQQQYPTSALYAVGSSAGTALLVRYLGEQAENTPLKAAFALSPGYNTESSFAHVHPFYSQWMTKKLRRVFIQPYQKTWQTTASLSQILKAKNLVEFEKNYVEMTGYADYENYSQAINPMYVFENIKIPVMVLNAEDDPICHIENFQPYKARIQNMSHVAVVTTKHGSHCGFYEGLTDTRSWATQLMADFLKLQHQLTSNA